MTLATQGAVLIQPFRRCLNSVKIFLQLENGVRGSAYPCLGMVKYNDAPYASDSVRQTVAPLLRRRSWPHGLGLFPNGLYILRSIEALSRLSSTRRFSQLEFGG